MLALGCFPGAFFLAVVDSFFVCYPDMRFHDLRHGAATILLSKKVNVKVIQELLGHSDIITTLGVYGHLLPTMQEGAMDMWDDEFGEDDEDEGGDGVGVK